MRLRADSRISSCRTFNSFSNWASRPAFSESNFATYSCNLSLKSFSISKWNPDHRWSVSLSLHRNLPAVRELASERSCCCWACVSATIFLMDSVTASLISSVRLREYSSTCRCVDPENRHDQFLLLSLSRRATLTETSHKIAYFLGVFHANLGLGFSLDNWLNVNIVSVCWMYFRWARGWWSTADGVARHDRAIWMCKGLRLKCKWRNITRTSAEHHYI